MSIYDLRHISVSIKSNLLLKYKCIRSPLISGYELPHKATNIMKH